MSQKDRHNPFGNIAVRQGALESAAEQREAGQHASSLLGSIAAVCTEVSHWLFVLVVVLLPIDIYYQIPGQSRGIFASQLITVEACAVFVVGLVAARLAHARTHTAPGWRELWPLGLMLVSTVLSFAIAQHKSDALRDVGKTAFFLGIYLLARSASQDARFRGYARWALLLGFVLVALCGIYLALPNVPDIPGALLNIQRDQATLSGTAVPRQAATFRFPVEFNEYLLIALPILSILVIQFRSLASKSAVAMLCGVAIALMIGTYTRSGLLICVVLFPVMVFLLGFKRIAVASLVAGVLALTVLVAIDRHVAARMLSILAISSDASGVTEGRLQIWQWALHIFLHHLFLGVGPRNLQYQPGIYINPASGTQDNTAENSYASLLAQQGVVGAIALMCILVGAFRRLIPWLRQGVRKQEQWWAIAAVVALLALLIDATVHPAFSSAQVTGLLCVVVGLVPRPGSVSASPAEDIPPARTADPWKATHFPEHSQDQARVLHEGPRSRIVFLVNSPSMGGANRHAINIAHQLRLLGVNVLLLVPPGALARGEALQLGIPVREAKMGMNIGRWKGCLGTLSLLNPLDTWRSLMLIRRLNEEEPTIFICPHPREQLLTSWLAHRDGLRSVWVVHAPFRYLAHRLIIKPMWLRASWRAYAVVPVSRGLAKQLREAGVSPTRLHHIYNMTHVPPLGSWSEIPRQPYLIGCAARLVKAKGVQYVIEAMPDVLRRFPQARLAIAGAGAYEPELRKQAQRLGIENVVTFVGHLSNPREFLGSLHVFAHATVDPGEVIPTVILEAASVQTAVVASRIASIPEEVIDGSTGILVEPGNVPELARAITALLADPARTMAYGAAGRQLVATKFSIEQAGVQFLHLLTDVEDDLPLSPAEEKETRTMAAIHRQTLVSRSAIVLASKVITALATAFWTVMAARTLLPSDYGNLAIVAGLIDLGAYLSDVGLQSIATRELATLSERETRRFLSSTIYLKVLLSLVGTGAILIVAFVLPFGIGVQKVMLVLGPSLFFSSLSTLTLVFRARSTLIWVLVISVASAVVSFAMTLAVFLAHGDVLAFAKAQLIASIFSGVLTLAVVLWRYAPSLRPYPRHIASLFKAALPIGLSTALIVIYYRLDVPILGLLASSAEVAKYTSAYRFLDGLTLLPASLQAIALPQISALMKRGTREVVDYSQRFLDMAIMLGCVLALLLSFAAPYLLQILYAGRYGDATEVLRVLAWAGAATLVTNVFVPIIIVLGRTRSMLAVSAIGLVVNLSINILFIPRFGALAAAYATLATEIAVIVSYGFISIHALRWRLELRVIIGALVATGMCEYLLAMLGSHASWLPSPLSQAWTHLPWPLAAMMLCLLWGLFLLPFSRMRQRLQRRARQSAGITAKSDMAEGFGRRANNTIWLLAGVMPSTLWVRLSKQQPSDADHNGEARGIDVGETDHPGNVDAYRHRGMTE